MVEPLLFIHTMDTPRIKFADIARFVEQALAEHKTTAHPTLEEIIATDTWAREKVRQLIGGDNL